MDCSKAPVIRLRGKPVLHFLRTLVESVAHAIPIVVAAAVLGERTVAIFELGNDAGVHCIGDPIAVGVTAGATTRDVVDLSVRALAGTLTNAATLRSRAIFIAIAV